MARVGQEGAGGHLWHKATGARECLDQFLAGFGNSSATGDRFLRSGRFGREERQVLHQAF